MECNRRDIFFNNLNGEIPHLKILTFFIISIASLTVVAFSSRADSPLLLFFGNQNQSSAGHLFYGYMNNSESEHGIRN